MRTVFTNDMCVHVWAQQSQSHGRSGSISFEGATLRSYSTPIAAIHPNCVLITSRSYSVTTSHHCSLARRAVSGRTVFRVPSLGATTGPIDHAANLAYYAREYARELARLKRARIFWQSALDYLTPYSDAWIAYAKVFRLPKPKINPQKDAAEVEARRARLEAARNTPAAIAKRERDRVRREEREAEKARLAREEAATRLARWRAGEDVPSYALSAFPPALRLNGDTVQTSWGAEVPIADAKEAFHRVNLARCACLSWSADPERPIHLGHFTLSSISPEGNIVVGCHRINWTEIEALARAAGWLY